MPIASRSRESRPSLSSSSRAADSTQPSTASGPSATWMGAPVSAWMRPVRSLIAMRTCEAPTSTASTTRPLAVMANWRARAAAGRDSIADRADEPQSHERIDAKGDGRARESGHRGQFGAGARAAIAQDLEEIAGDRRPEGVDMSVVRVAYVGHTVTLSCQSAKGSFRPTLRGMSTQERVERSRSRRAAVAAGVALLLTVGLGLLVTLRTSGPGEPRRRVDGRRSSSTARPLWEVPARVFDFIGGGWFGVLVVPVGIAVAFLIVRRPWAASAFILGSAVSSGVVQLMKVTFGRHRPEDILVPLDSRVVPLRPRCQRGDHRGAVALLLSKRWIAIVGAGVRRADGPQSHLPRGALGHRHGRRRVGRWRHGGAGLVDLRARSCTSSVRRKANRGLRDGC